LWLENVTKQAINIMTIISDLIKKAGIEPAIPDPTPDPEPNPTPTPEPTPEPTPTPPPTPEPKPTPELPSRLKILGEAVGVDFSTDEDFDTWKTSITAKDTQITESQTRIKDLEKEKEELVASFNPRGLFASDDFFLLNGLMMKHPDKNPLVLAEISSKDFSKTYIENPIEVMAVDLMLENPGVYTNKADAIEDVLGKYDIGDVNDISPASKRRLQVDAKQTTEKFNKIKKEITIPENVNLAEEKTKKDKAESERKTKVKEATTELFTKKIPAAVKEIDFPTITGKDDKGKNIIESAFQFSIGEDFVKSKAAQNIINSVWEHTIQNESEWTPEKESQLMADITDMLKASYLYHHRGQAFLAIFDEVRAKQSDDAWLKRHNVRPLNEHSPAPKADEQGETLAKQQKDFLKKRGIKI